MLALWVAGFMLLFVLATAFLLPDYKFIVPVYKWAEISLIKQTIFTYQNSWTIAISGVIFSLLFGVASWLTGDNPLKVMGGFFVIFLLAIFSLIVAGNKTVNSYGVEYVVFALLIGLFINNFFTLPEWIKKAVRSEFYIKVGLVILGSSVLFTDILRAGLPGMLQALGVVAVVWFFSFWLSRKFKLDDEFAVILSSAVSICGVSAAIVAAGAIQGDKRKLSYVTTLVLLVAIPMLLFQPWAIRYFHIPEIVGGAWLGGTLDTTASVTAASELVGPQALKVGVIVKFSQNVLIGVAALFIASWWALRKNREARVNEESAGKTVWNRFPKFVLGFIAVSLLFSFFIPVQSVKQVSGVLNAIRTIWFGLAFVSIGMEAKFMDLFRTEAGRPAMVFVLAQLFNIVWTLLIAYLLFGGKLFPVPQIN